MPHTNRPQPANPPSAQPLMAHPNRHQTEWTASGLRRAAAEAGVELPIAYSQKVAADGLDRESELGVTRLGAGVVIHTQPDTNKRLPLVLGYADGRGQWYRDGRRHTETTSGPVSDAVAEPAREVAL